jgi:hypothetical protein
MLGGEVREKKVMSELVEFLSLSNPLELCSVYFKGMNKERIGWLDGDRPTPQFIIIYFLILKN